MTNTKEQKQTPRLSRAVVFQMYKTRQSQRQDKDTDTGTDTDTDTYKGKDKDRDKYGRRGQHPLIPKDQDSKNKQDPNITQHHTREDRTKQFTRHDKTRHDMTRQDIGKDKTDREIVVIFYMTKGRRGRDREVD
jgi:hypothetical protein